MKRVARATYDLTWLEAMRWGRPAPRWKRLLAPLQHWWLVTFCGYGQFDAFDPVLDQDVVPGTGQPLCGECGEPVAHCYCPDRRVRRVA